MQIHGTHGGALPFFPDDFNVENLALGDFDPITTLHDADNVHPDEMSEERAEAKYAKRGFLVRPNAAGAVYVVTWRQYVEALRAGMTRAERLVVLAALVPKAWDGVDGQWCDVPVVKVFGNDGDGTGHYETVATEIIVGIIL